MTCHLDGCGEQEHSHGYCHRHWTELPPHSQAFVHTFAPRVYSPVREAEGFLRAVAVVA